MLALSACMQSALHHINSTWPFTEQTLFVDDHTWASPSLHELQQVKSRHSFWQHYTATIGIPENTKKAQYLIDGDRLGAKLWRKLYGLRLRLQPPRPHHLPWHHLDLGPHNRPMLHCEAEIQPRQHRKRNYVPEPSQLQHLPAPPPPHHVGVPANVSAHIKSQGQAARHSKHYRTSQATTTTACHQRRTRTTAEATDAQGATPLCQSLPQHQPANQQPNASTATSMRRPETIATSTQRKPAGLKQNLPPYNALQKIQQLPHTRATPQQI